MQPAKAPSLGELFKIQFFHTFSELDQALTSNSDADLRRVAHSCAGASATCGMITMVPIMRALEKLAIERNLAEAHSLVSQAKAQFKLIGAFIDQQNALLKAGIRA